MQRLHLIPRLQRHNDVFLFQFRGGAEFFQCRIPPKPSRQDLRLPSDTIAIFLQGAAYLHHTVIPEKAFNLSGDQRHRIGGKLHIVVQIKIIHCLDQSDGADLPQILQVMSPSRKTPDDTIHQRHVLFYHLFSRHFIPCPCLFDQFYGFHRQTPL